MIAAAPQPVEETKDPAQIEAMFSRIATRYDLGNRVLSFGRDMAWRRKGVRMAAPADDANILDMACGTADMMAVVMRRKGFRGHVIGVDLSKAMLEVAEKKLRGIHTRAKYELRQGNVLELPDADSMYDLVTVCWGIRNFSDPQRGFSEVKRLLKPGGKFLVIEFFAIDKEPGVVRFYLKYILPPLGGLVSGGRFAYKYLSTSKQNFMTSDAFIKMGESVGLRLIGRRVLTFGVAEIILFQKGL